MNYIISGTTDIGLSKSTNQDSYAVRLIDTNKGKIVFAILCDGMGGLSKGEVASASLVHAFSTWVNNRLPSLIEVGFDENVIAQEWNKIAIEYNEKIKAYGKAHGASMGTTLTAMLITQEKYYVINVGDTRAYEITDQVTVLTKDQTVVSREIELGYLTEEQAKVDSRRSVLLQCIGASEEVVPDIYCGTTRTNAVYMLCSDGFRHEITPEEIMHYLNPSVMLDADGMTNNMNTLIEINKQRQERDNITVVSIRTF